jgi:hypothetical protein
MNLFTSLMRTLVPIAAGLVLTLAARTGLHLDGEMVTLAAGAGLMAAYYAAFRVLEAAADRIGWRPLQLLAGVMLGWARPPQYVEPITAPLRFKVDQDALNADLANFRRILGIDGDKGRP